MTMLGNLIFKAGVMMASSPVSTIQSQINAQGTKFLVPFLAVIQDTTGIVALVATIWQLFTMLPSFFDKQEGQRKRHQSGMNLWGIAVITLILAIGSGIWKGVLGSWGLGF